MIYVGRLLSPLFFIGFALSVHSQDAWTLQRCLEHARENNISLKQVQLRVDEARAGFQQAWAQMLPTANINSDFSENYGLSFDPNSLTLQNDNYTTFFTGASANMLVFGGLQRYYNLRSAINTKEAARLDFQQALDDMYLNVADLFLQTLFAQERAQIAEKQEQLLRIQCDRTKLLYESGALNKGEWLLIEAQRSTQEIQLVRANNALTLTKLALSQALNLPTPEIELDTAETLRMLRSVSSESAANISPDQLFQSAQEQRPGLKAAEARVAAGRQSLWASRGSYLPSLSAGARINTVYSGLRKQNPFDPTSPPIPFLDQVRLNNSQTLNLNLMIPLFNGLGARTAVQRARLSLIGAELSVTQERQTLRNTVYRAWADAQAAEKSREANRKNVEALRLSFSYVQSRFEVQASNAFEMNDATTKLFNAEAEFVIAQFDALFKHLVLKFYQGQRFAK
ncbi:MAG: TolC family protein [Bacteroidia bacterium]|jgi:outer membrane protein